MSTLRKTQKSKRTEDLITSEADEAEIWESVRGLAFSFVRRYPNDDWDDLMQECYFAMRTAIEKWDPEKGAFSTVFRNWVFSYVSKYYGKNSYLTEALYSRVQKVKRFRLEYYIKHGDYPTDQETMDALGISRQKLDYIINGIRNEEPLSLYTAPEGVEDVTRLDTLVDPCDRIEETERACDRSLLSDVVSSILATLTPRNRDIVTRYYGLDGQEAASGPKLAEEYGLSRQRINVILHTALDKITNGKDRTKLRSYFDNYLYTHNITRHTGLSSFRCRGGSVQELAVINAEEQQQKDR